MIQFNLLPDIKLEYIKAAKLKRLVISISLIVIAVTVAIVGFMGSIYAARTSHLNALNEDIKKASEDLTGTGDISKILTIQNQLNSLPALHEQKPVASRIFDFLTLMTPSTVTLNEMEVNFVDSTLSFEGDADLLSHVNEFVDTIKFTNLYVTYTSEKGATPTFTFGEVGPQEEPKEEKNEQGEDISIYRVRGKAFSEVVLSEFTRNDGKLSYEITAKYEPLLFDGTNKVELQVPQRVTTRSEVEKPLFEINSDITEDQ